MRFSVYSEIQYHGGKPYRQLYDEVLEQMRVGARRRLLHRQDLHVCIADIEVRPMTIDRRIGNEVVEMRVVLEYSVVGCGVIHKAPEESECVGFP